MFLVGKNLELTSASASAGAALSFTNRHVRTLLIPQPSQWCHVSLRTKAVLSPASCSALPAGNPRMASALSGAPQSALHLERGIDGSELV